VISVVLVETQQVVASGAVVRIVVLQALKHVLLGISEVDENLYTVSLFTFYCNLSYQ